MQGRRPNYRLTRDVAQKLFQTLVQIHIDDSRSGRNVYGAKVVAYNKLAEIFETSPVTVRGWVTRGIPEGRWAHVKMLLDQRRQEIARGIKAAVDPYEDRPELFAATKVLERIYKATGNGRNHRWR